MNLNLCVCNEELLRTNSTQCLKANQPHILYMKEKGILLLAVILTGILVNSSGVVFAKTNSSSTAETQEGTDNLGQYVSAYVHEHIALFKQQRTETIEAIKDCREKIKNADNKEDRKAVLESCKATLKDIREKYKTEREEYRKLFKEYRDSMKILIKEAKGLAVSDAQKEKAVKDIGESKEMQAKMKQERLATKDKIEK